MRLIPLLLVAPRRVVETPFGEFAEAVRVLEKLPGTRIVEDFSACVEALRTDNFPAELLVILQSRPGEFSSLALTQLQQFAPLARTVLVVGSWCEGEVRSGKPEPGCLRIAASRWEVWWAVQWQRLAEEQTPAWALPCTMTDEERQLLVPSAMNLRSVVPLTIGILAGDRATFAALSEAGQQYGHAVVSLSPGATDPLPTFDVAFWNGRTGDLIQARAMPALCGNRPWIAILDFPRVEDCRELRTLGATAVFARPLDLDELFNSVQRGLSR